MLLVPNSSHFPDLSRYIPCKNPLFHRKSLFLLHMCIFCCTFELLPWLISSAFTSPANSLVATATPCSPYSSFRSAYLQKNRLRLVICYPILHSQASLDEYCISSEIDKSIFFFANIPRFACVCAFFVVPLHADIIV